MADDGVGGQGEGGEGGEGGETAKKRKKLQDILDNPQAAERYSGITGSYDKLSDYDPRTGRRSPTTTIYPNMPMGGTFMGETDLFKASPLGRGVQEAMGKLGIQGVDLDKVAWTTSDYRKNLAGAVRDILGRNVIPSAADSSRGGRLLSGRTAATNAGRTLLRWPGKLKRNTGEEA